MVQQKALVWAPRLSAENAVRDGGCPRTASRETRLIVTRDGYGSWAPVPDADGSRCLIIFDLDTADHPLLRVLHAHIENTAAFGTSDVRLCVIAHTTTYVPSPASPTALAATPHAPVVLEHVGPHSRLPTAVSARELLLVCLTTQDDAGRLRTAA